MKTTEIKNPAAYLRRAEHNRIANEAQHDKTRQRKFELSFLSIQAMDEIDPDKNLAASATNDDLLAIGRRDFSLRSPADQVQFNLDFEYYEELLGRIDTWLLIVFRAVFYGFSWKDLGIPQTNWLRWLKKVENILAREA